MTVSNSFGQDTETKANYITVNEAGSPPVADFVGSPTTIGEGESVQFTDQSTNNPTSGTWNFGDGQTSPERHPSHVYASAGTYTVSLTVMNSFGQDTETKANYITVISSNTPNIDTDPVTGVSQTYATSGGNITSYGGSPILEKGICWSTSSNPDISDSHIPYENEYDDFVSYMTNLTPGTTYYVRAYATNSSGTGYGTQYSFRTLDASLRVTDYDGNTYQTVQIGDQFWMAENLRTTHYADGSSIELVESQTEWDATPYQRSYCWHDNNPAFGEYYGAYYNCWTAMNGQLFSNTNPSGVQGVCPAGWHLPSSSEWDQLEAYLGANPGDKLKSYGPNWAGQDLTMDVGRSGFMAHPAGVRREGIGFTGATDVGYFWTSTSDNPGISTSIRSLYFNEFDIGSFEIDILEGVSVRCVRD